MEKYILTEEHKAQQKPWADKWIKIAMSTESMTDKDKELCRGYVNDMYDVTKIPRPEHILFSPSPIATSIIGGFATAIYHLGDKSPITVEAMYKMVIDYGKNNRNTNVDRWWNTPYDKKKLAEMTGLGEVGLQGIKYSQSMWNGGNQWVGWVVHITFFRYIAKFDIDYTNWNSYEKLTELSGPRVVHSKFCVISDRPTKLKVNAQNQPHCEDGPFKTWSDGTSIYSVNGVRVPAYVVDSPETITIKKIEEQPNVEVRRVMIDKYGKDKYIIDIGATLLHTDDYGSLYVKELPDDPAPLMMVKVVNSTAEPDGSFKDYYIRVDPAAYGGLKTAQAAVASSWRNEDGSLLFEKPEDYVCEVET